MNKLNLKINDTAIGDMEKISDYIARDDKAAALKMLQLFYKAFENLCSYPSLGVIRKDFTYRDVRFLKVHKRYIVVYNFDEQNIYVLRVLSNYQNICNLL